MCVCVCVLNNRRFFSASKHTAFSLAALNNKQLLFFPFLSFAILLFKNRSDGGGRPTTNSRANVLWPKKSWLKPMHTSNVYFRSLGRFALRRCNDSREKDVRCAVFAHLRRSILRHLDFIRWQICIFKFKSTNLLTSTTTVRCSCLRTLALFSVTCGWVFFVAVIVHFASLAFYFSADFYFDSRIFSGVKYQRWQRTWTKLMQRLSPLSV